jgi:predicted phosphodiesterase
MNIIMNRRNFLAGATAFSLAGCKSGLGGFFSGRPGLKMGVLSDIHITDWASAEIYRKTLRWYRDQGVDAVLIAGDLTDHGIAIQMENFAKAWFDVFPDDTAPDGRRVERLFVTGNHDPDGLDYRDKAMDRAFAVHGLTYEEAKKLQLRGGDAMAKTWEECFHEKYEPIWRKNVKGYDVVGAHWDSWQGVRGLEDWFKANAAKIDTGRPFFFVQHAHPKDTVYGPWAWGHDGGQSTRALSPYANAVAFSGHSHTTLTDERSVWRGAFTSIGTSSLSYVCLQGPRANRQELNDATRDGLSIRQGQLVTVYDDRLVLQRRDFCRDEDVDTAWNVEMPAKASPFAARAAKSAVPAFASGAEAKLAFDTGTLSFPSATANAAARPYEYEVTLETRDCDVEGVQMTRRLYHPTAALPRVHDAEVATVEFQFAPGEIPAKTEIRLSVRPLNSYGVRGAAISTAWLVKPQPKKS